jgi:hypothetical protein
MLKRSRLVLFALSVSLVPSLGTPQIPPKESAKAVTDKSLKKLNSPGSMSGPILGLVFDPIRGGLRPVLGTPGASTLGDILEVGISTSQAWIAPRQDFALAEIKDTKEIVLLDLNRDPISVSSIGIANLGSDHLAFSPTGASVVMHHRASHSIQLITGLPSAPALVAEIDISGLSESLSALAVSDDGGAALLGVIEGESGSVYVVTQWTEAAPVSVVGQAADGRSEGGGLEKGAACRSSHGVTFLRRSRRNAERRSPPRDRRCEYRTDSAA